MTSVIIDGPDKCFKSTTCRLVKTAFALEGRDVPVYRSKTLTESFLNKETKKDLFLNKLRYTTTSELDMLEQLNFDIIFDRHYPSEFVYSKYYNRVTDYDVLKNVDQRFALANTKIIILRRARGYKDFTDDLDPSIDLEKIDLLYDEFAGWTVSNNIITLFVDLLSEKERIAQIFSFIKQ